MNRLRQERFHYAPAIALARVLPRKRRAFFLKIFGFGGALFLISFFALLALGQIDLIAGIPDVSKLLVYSDIFLGFGLIFASTWLLLFLFHAFFNSFYFRGMPALARESGRMHARSGITYGAANVLYFSLSDLTEGFVRSPYGRLILWRAGVPEERRKEFLKKKRSALSPDVLRIPDDRFLDIADIAETVLRESIDFQSFLFDSGVTEEVYRGSVNWIARHVRMRKEARRWWGRDSLGRVPPIGAAWSYGRTYNLQAFVKDIGRGTVYGTIAKAGAYTKPYVEQLETILSRAKEANAIVVGREGVGKMDIVARLARDIAEGTSLPHLSNKRVVSLNFESLIASHGTKDGFEQKCMALFAEAERAGNIILVIEDLPAFVESARMLGSDALGILDPYLNSPELSIIATADPDRYHRELEAQPQVMRRFERVQVEDVTVENAVRVLEDVADSYERDAGMLFTYPAILHIAESADRFITDGVMPDKAVDLLVEVAPAAARAGIKQVGREFVEEYVSAKTGVPSGAIGGEEKELLLRLEERLHEKIIGQEEAVRAVSGVMRRVRAGVHNPKRPMGSFLFLGPTGVGKTQTAKTLAEVFFGSAEKMLRLDMSEYNTPEATRQLIGSAAGGTSGVLSDMLKERPYGVLLIDEFEKSGGDVIDLFLQILDEGMFTNARGEKINARNVLLIATSNAGSDLIWEYMQKGTDLAEQKDAIINAIVARGIYRPELMNRFDATILFHPLGEEELLKIAKLMLDEFKERIRVRGFKLSVEDGVLAKLVKKGYNPEFGARPMRRVLQDVVEEHIAQKIISEGLKPGSTITLTEDDVVL